MKTIQEIYNKPRDHGGVPTENIELAVFAMDMKTGTVYSDTGVYLGSIHGTYDTEGRFTSKQGECELLSEIAEEAPAQKVPKEVVVESKAAGGVADMVALKEAGFDIEDIMAMRHQGLI